MGLRAPAPILATYMARRPPAFTRNLAQARHINIAHGLYPRRELPERRIERLVAALRETVTVDGGRTYAGGLTKFEPREMERVLVPGPELLLAGRLTVAVAFEPPPRWGREEIEGDIARRSTASVAARFEEPRDLYARWLEECHVAAEELIELTVDLTQLGERAVEVVREPRLLHALRFLPGPFISEADLAVIAETRLSARALSSPDAARRIVDSVLAGLDRRRFAWLSGGWVPSPEERDAAALATASLMATEKVRTWRRNAVKSLQEDSVAEALRGAGFREVPTRKAIRTLEDAPGRGEFCRETTFGGRKADVLVGLPDRRRMPIECKVSNSDINSIKRVLNDAAAKATTWLDEFGAHPGRAHRRPRRRLQAGDPRERSGPGAHAVLGAPAG